MKKTTIAAALAATTLLASHAGAYELRNSFVGANGGTRVITDTVTVGDVTTFTVETTNRHGRVKTKTFTATFNGENFDVSGSSKQLFKDFLSAHARQAQGMNNIVQNESQDLNRLAYNAWREYQITRFEAAGLGGFADSIRSVQYQLEFDFIGRADELGLDYMPADISELAPTLSVLGEASAPFEHVAEYDIPLHLTFAERTPKVVNIYDMIGIEGVSEAHAQGWTGKGVKVANRDSSEGTHDDHSEHAIWTIAPEAQIDHLRLNDYGPEYNLEQYSVINHSYGITNTFGLHHGGFSALVEKAVREAPNALHTWAAGNDSTYRGPLGWAPECEFVGEGFHRGFSVDTCTGFKDIVEKGAYELLDNVIIVGHDRNGAMRAGELKDHYITSNRSRISGSTGGTSIAAPKVAGVAALVKQKFPTLGPKEIKQVILSGAIDIGAPGVDEVFGHGMLSVTGALAPRGDLF